MHALPAGHAAHPLAGDDVEAVVRLVRACEQHDSGAALFERADLVSDLATVERSRDAIVVRDDAGAIAAWAMVLHRRSRWADVHPDHRGRGIGAALVSWSVSRGRQLGADRIGQTIEDGRTDAEALFRAAGSVPVRTSWILRRPVDSVAAGRLEPVGPPQGVTLRASTPADEDDALDLMELAFSEWPDRLPSARATWRALVIQREGFAHDHLQLAVSDAGRIVGAAVLLDDEDELWVDKLATHPGFRDRGIGRALLERAIGLAQARGRAGTSLSTDSITGALPFYERLGFRVTRSFTHWAIPLGAAMSAPSAGPR